MSTAFYPGAGTDIVPPILFRNIKQWNYMDSQPNSEFGNKIEEGFSRPHFIPKLLTVMNQNDFKLLTVQDDVYTFYNSEHNQTICYETNRVFPTALRPYHFTYTLVLCGYMLTNPPPNFIASYSHIITDSKTGHSTIDENILSTKQVHTMIYDEKWEYWIPSNHTIHKIQSYVKIIDKFLI